MTVFYIAPHGYIIPAPAIALSRCESGLDAIAGTTIHSVSVSCVCVFMCVCVHSCACVCLVMHFKRGTRNSPKNLRYRIPDAIKMHRVREETVSLVQLMVIMNLTGFVACFPPAC